MRKVALIGRAPQTRHYIPDIPEDVEIWIIAAVHNLEELPRQPDLCVDMHRIGLLKQKEYYQHHTMEMWEYLKEPQPYPIYMQEAYPEIPSSVQYPTMGVLQMLPNVFRGDAINEFMTSSFDWLIALAIYQKDVDVIYIYGWDMGSETEYRYQREGAHWWLGVAAGRGIQIEIPPECSLVRTTSLYGLGRAQAITREELTQLFQEVEKRVNSFEAEHGKDFTGGDDLYENYLRNSGVKQLYNILLHDHLVDGWVSRQRLEEHNRRLTNSMFTMQAEANRLAGMATMRRKMAEKGGEVEQKEYTEAIDSQQFFLRETYLHEGAVQAVGHLINVIDLQADLDGLELKKLQTPVIVKVKKEAS